MPKTVGGSKVHLLLGIKNTKIQPVLIKVLPSGVGVYLSPFKDMDGSRIIYAGPSKCFTRIDNEQNLESNYAIYTVFGTGIENEPCNTELYGEYRYKSKDTVRISPLTDMVRLKDKIGNLNVSNEPFDCNTDTLGSLIEPIDIEHKGFGLIVSKEFSENDIEFIDFPGPKPEPGLELIDFKDFSKPEPETTDFSEPELNLT